jgi:hypothetical protein
MATTASSSATNSGNALPTSAIGSAIGKLQELGINFLAIDFDQTILDIHTGGQWKGTLEELIPHVRPVFSQLIQAAVESNIHVAVVTFSSQVSIVRGVLDYMVGIQASQQIPIRGGDRSWKYKGGGSTRGKQAHMASAVEELEAATHHGKSGEEGGSDGVHITKNTTLLLDDDANNIRFALSEHVRAIWFNPKKPHLLLQDIAKLV